MAAVVKVGHIKVHTHYTTHDHSPGDMYGPDMSAVNVGSSQGTSGGSRRPERLSAWEINKVAEVWVSKLPSFAQNTLFICHSFA